MPVLRLIEGVRVEYTEIVIVREWIYFRHGGVFEDSIPWCLHQLRRQLKKKMAENTEVREHYEEALTAITSLLLLVSVFGVIFR